MLKILANEKTKTAEIYFYGTVGYEITATGLLHELKSGDFDALNIRINSGGGDVIEANAIFNIIQNFKGETTAIIEGIAGSAASYIMLACKKIRACENATIFIHNPLVEWASGNAKQLEKVAEDLKKFEAQYVEAYVKKSGRDENEIRILMDAETLMTATEAKEYGLIDEIVGNGESERAANARAYLKMVAQVNILPLKGSGETKTTQPKGEVMTKKEIITNLNSIAETLSDEAKELLVSEIKNIEEFLVDKEDKKPEENKEGAEAKLAEKLEQLDAKLAELDAVKAQTAEANKKFLAKYALGSVEKTEVRKSKYEQYEALVKSGKFAEARELLRKK